MKAELIWPDTSFPYYPEGLIEACRRGDHKAMLKVYKIYYKPVFRSCLSVVRDPAVAEDMMQESFLTAFENLGSYSKNISFIEWLITNIKYA
jgi:RNA polymerase sigma-70 factor (ECF subfamily)